MAGEKGIPIKIWYCFCIWWLTDLGLSPPADSLHRAQSRWNRGQGSMYATCAANPIQHRLIWLYRPSYKPNLVERTRLYALPPLALCFSGRRIREARWQRLARCSLKWRGQFSGIPVIPSCLLWKRTICMPVSCFPIFSSCRRIIDIWISTRRCLWRASDW